MNRTTPFPVRQKEGRKKRRPVRSMRQAAERFRSNRLAGDTVAVSRPSQR